VEGVWGNREVPPVRRFKGEDRRRAAVFRRREEWFFGV
jgi:hypothetical protein